GPAGSLALGPAEIDPLRATNTVFPSGAACTPRGRLPTLTVPMSWFVATSIAEMSPDPSLLTYTRGPCGGGGDGMTDGAGAAGGAASTAEATGGALGAGLASVVALGGVLLQAARARSAHTDEASRAIRSSRGSGSTFYRGSLPRDKKCAWDARVVRPR